jgi:hypothetical protein
MIMPLEPALSGLLVDERPLQRVRLLEGAQSLQGGDLVIPDVSQGSQTRPCEFSTHDGGARTALPETATELWTIQFEIVAQHIQQRGLRSGGYRMRLAVYRNSVCHLLSTNMRRPHA